VPIVARTDRLAPWTRPTYPARRTISETDHQEEPIIAAWIGDDPYNGPWLVFDEISAYYLTPDLEEGQEILGISRQLYDDVMHWFDRLFADQVASNPGGDSEPGRRELLRRLAAELPDGITVAPSRKGPRRRPCSGSHPPGPAQGASPGNR